MKDGMRAMREEQQELKVGRGEAAGAGAQGAGGQAAGKRVGSSAACSKCSKNAVAQSLSEDPACMPPRRRSLPL